MDAAGNSSSSDEVVFDTAHQGGGEGSSPVVIIEAAPEAPKNTVKEDQKSTEKIVENETPETAQSMPTEISNESVEISLSTPEEKTCTVYPYLKNPIKLYRKNNAEDVKLLEQFLNRHENANLVVDGVYSRTDFNAVIKWQEKHAKDILSPWGLKKGTGYIYKTSLAKIKEIEEGICK